MTSLKLAYQGGVGLAIGFCSLAFTACQYDVPITSGPTRKVQERLLGDWTSADAKEKLKLRSLDDSVYVVYYDGDLYRAYHSNVGETAFVTVQDLNSSDRKYACVTWKLSDDAKSLRLRNVNDKVVPKGTKDSTTVLALLTKTPATLSISARRSSFKKRNSWVQVVTATGLTFVGQPLRLPRE